MTIEDWANVQRSTYNIQVKTMPSEKVHCAAAGRCHQSGDQVPSGQQWLAAVQDQRDLPQAVRPGVLPDPAGGQVRGLLGHRTGLVTPGLVCHFVHVAVIARQIAAAVHLDDELPKGERSPPVVEEGCDVQACGPFKP